MEHVLTINFLGTSSLFFLQAAFLIGAGVTFALSLNDEIDPYRALHGVSQGLAGTALYFLWQAIPPNNYKKTDELIVLP